MRHAAGGPRLRLRLRPGPLEGVRGAGFLFRILVRSADTSFCTLRTWHVHVALRRARGAGEGPEESPGAPGAPGSCEGEPEEILRKPEENHLFS